MKSYEKLGIAAMIPGMQHMIDLMQQELDRMREMLVDNPVEDKKIERDKKIRGAKMSNHMKKYWAKMTPEQRSKEFARRMAIRKKKVA
jgi:hypothetical protein